jgi:hypothetical protein
MDRSCSRYEKIRNSYKNLVEKPERKRRLGRSRRRWGNIIMDLLENRVRICGLDSSGSEQELVAGSYEHSSEPSGSMKGGNFLTE